MNLLSRSDPVSSGYFLPDYPVYGIWPFSLSMHLLLSSMPYESQILFPILDTSHWCHSFWSSVKIRLDPEDGPANKPYFQVSHVARPLDIRDAQISCKLSVIRTDSGIFDYLYLYLYLARDIFTLCIWPAKCLKIQITKKMDFWNKI